MLLAPDFLSNLFHQFEFVPLLEVGQLVADLAGGKTTLRAQAEAVHFSASWMWAITVSLYTEEKTFTQEQVQQLFLSVGWVSGQYPQRLYKALMHSSTVLTVWDGDKLVGLIRVLDDSEMLAQIHYVLVHPDYQGQGIAGEMLERIKEKYKNYLYIEGMPEGEKNVPFYEKHGFQRMKHGAAIQICNYSDKR